MDKTKSFTILFSTHVNYSSTAWSMYFFGGGVTPDNDKSGNMYVRCVL